MSGNNIKPYFLVEKEGTSQVYDQIGNVEILIDYEDAIRYGGVSRKQLDLYCYRNKEYRTVKYKKKKLISINILGYLLENIERVGRKMKQL